MVEQMPQPVIQGVEMINVKYEYTHIVALPSIASGVIMETALEFPAVICLGALVPGGALFQFFLEMVGG